MCVEPRKENASLTALEKAGVPAFGSPKWKTQGIDWKTFAAPTRKG